MSTHTPAPTALTTLFPAPAETLPLPTLPPLVSALANAVAQAGGRALLVGGFVRDLLSGHAPGDLDLEIFGLEAPVLENLTQKLARGKIVGKDFGILKLAGLDVSLPNPSDTQAVMDSFRLLPGFPSPRPLDAATSPSTPWHATPSPVSSLTAGADCLTSEPASCAPSPKKPSLKTLSEYFEQFSLFLDSPSHPLHLPVRSAPVWHPSSPLSRESASSMSSKSSCSKVAGRSVVSSSPWTPVYFKRCSPS